MKIFSLLVAMLIIFSCATKSKSKDISKVETEVSNQTQSGQESGIGIKSQNNYKGKGMSEFAQAVSFTNWGYSGVQGDEFSLTITETENGYQMTAKGAGTANAGKSEVNKQSKWQQQYESKIDSVAKAFENRYFEFILKSEAKSKDLIVEKKSTGFQAGVYIMLGVGSIVLILLLFFGWKLRKLSTSVREILQL